MRGKSIEIPKELYDKIKIVAKAENKFICEFCRRYLGLVVERRAKKYGLNFDNKD